MASARSTWKRVKFGDVIRLNKDKSNDPAADGLERYVGLEHIEPGDLRVSAWGEVAEGTTFTNRFRPGQVLFGKRRAYQRKVAVADFEGVCSGDIYVLEPKNESELLPELLPFICITDAFFEHAVGTSAGSLSPRTNWKSLSGYEFPLPPVEEQPVVRDRLSACRKNLEATLGAHAELVALREALCQSWALAGTGDLAPDGSVPAEALPPGWTSATLQALCGHDEGAIGIGPFGSDLVAADYAHESGVPVIFVADVVRHWFSYTSAKYVTPAKAEQLSAHQAVGGDVLVTKMGWPPGEACVLPRDFPSAIITADVVRLRPDPRQVHAGYLAGILNSHWGAQQVVRISPGTTRPKTTLRDFSRIRVALPPVAEQSVRADALSEVQQQITALERRIDLAREVLVRVSNQVLVLS